MTPPPLPSHSLRRLLVALAICLVWVGPLWIAPVPPMVDYPRHLMQARILQGSLWDEPGFRDDYELSLARPHGLFPAATVALATVLPLNVAGKAVTSLFVLAIALGALALVRHAQRPAWYAWIATSAIYGYTFYWGLLANLAGYALVLLGALAADRAFSRPWSRKSWLLLTAIGLGFYPVHLLMLGAYVATVIWLAACRRPPLKTLLAQLSPLPVIAGVVVVLGASQGVLHAPPEGESFLVWGDLSARPTTLAIHAFGAHSDGGERWVGLLFLAVLGVAAYAGRGRLSSSSAPLVRWRFMILAIVLTAVYLLTPTNVGSIGLIPGRLPPLIAAFAAAGLPRPCGLTKARALLVVIGFLTLVQLRLTTRDMRVFERESSQLLSLIDHAKGGQRLAGLLFDQASQGVIFPPVFLHAQIYYQIFRGGRVAHNGAERAARGFRYGSSQVMATYAEGAWPDPGPVANPWAAARVFSFARDGERFDLFLVRADPQHRAGLVARAFRTGPPQLHTEIAGDWLLISKRP